MDKVHRLLQKQIQRGEWDDVSTHWGFFLAGCELLRARAFAGQGERQGVFVSKFTDVEAKLGKMHASLEESRKFVDALSLRHEICLEQLAKVPNPSPSAQNPKLQTPCPSIPTLSRPIFIIQNLVPAPLN